MLRSSCCGRQFSGDNRYCTAAWPLGYRGLWCCEYIIGLQKMIVVSNQKYLNCNAIAIRHTKCVLGMYHLIISTLSIYCVCSPLSVRTNCLYFLFVTSQSIRRWPTSERVWSDWGRRQKYKRREGIFFLRVFNSCRQCKLVCLSA